MTVLDLIAYVADGAILATYATSAYGKPVRWFHWANALGCFPIIGVEILAHAWPPLVLTAAFGIIGWGGLAQGREVVIDARNPRNRPVVPAEGQDHD